MTFSLVEAKVFTLLPDNTEFKEYMISGSSWAHAENRIGEKKRLQLEYNSDADITGLDMFINAALFMREDHSIYYAGKGSVYYKCNIVDATLGNVYDAPLQTSLTLSGYSIEVNENIEVRVLPNGINNFKIQVDFFMGSDCSDNYIRSTIDKSIDFLTSPANAPGTALDATNSNAASLPTVGNVYNPYNPGTPFPIQVRSPRVYVYAELPASFPLVATSTEYKFVGFKAGWYDQNAWTASPWFTDTGFILKRGGNPVSDFSSTQDTDVEIYATSANPANHVTKFIVWIIRTSQFNYYDNIYTNYDAEFEVIELANVSTGKLKAPMTDPVNTSGNIWKGTFKVSALDLTSTYRLVGIAYSDNSAYKVNSFISPLIPVVVGEVGPQYLGNGFDVRAALDDYNRQFEGNNLECVIEERMRAKIKLDFPFDKWKNDIFNRLGLVVGNDIRRYLTTVKVEIFEEFTDPNWGVIKNLFDIKVSNKIGVNQYTPQSGLDLQFSNAWAEFMYSFRNRFESSIPCIQTFVNGNNTIPVYSNQYWGGKNLTLRWTLTFLYDNYSTPFTDEIIIDQKLRVKDYGGMTVKSLDGEDFVEKSAFCQDEEMCLYGVLQSPLADRKLIVNIVEENGNINSINEAEVWEGNQLPQLTTIKIINEDEDYTVIFSETAAKACVDTTQLLVNSQYNVSFLAKKFVDTGYRITELLNDRIAENTDKRTIDNL